MGSGTASKPSTWNGAIVLQNGSSDVTFVGGSASTQGGGITVSPCGSSGPLSAWSASNCHSDVPAPSTTSYPLFYMTGTGTAITMGGGSCSFNGDSFAPNGTVAITAGSNVSYLIEAKSANLAAGSDVVDGTGPSVSPNQSTSTTTTTTTATKTGSSSPARLAARRSSRGCVVTINCS